MKIETYPVAEDARSGLWTERAGFAVPIQRHAAGLRTAVREEEDALETRASDVEPEQTAPAELERGGVSESLVPRPIDKPHPNEEEPSEETEEEPSAE